MPGAHEAAVRAGEAAGKIYRTSQRRGDARWKAWLRGHLERQRTFLLDVVAQVVAEERKPGREELATLGAEVAKLQRELAADGDVVDLPALPLKAR
jgi:hypothetical protein